MNNLIAAAIAVFLYFTIQVIVQANDGFQDTELELGCPVPSCN